MDGGILMLSEQNGFLERAFHVLNMVYFDGSLPEAVITIQSSQRAYGHITVERIWTDTSDAYHEINLSAEYLNRPVGNVIGTLLHEMCHLYAMESNIRDTSNGGRYHNRRFKEIAEQRDLEISHREGIGWSVTEPTEGLMETIRRHGLDSQIEFVRKGAAGWDSGGGGNGNGGDGSGAGGTGSDGGRPRKKTSTRKYICPSCHNSVRATKDVNIMCMDCNMQMVKKE